MTSQCMCGDEVGENEGRAVYYYAFMGEKQNKRLCDECAELIKDQIGPDGELALLFDNTTKCPKCSTKVRLKAVGKTSPILCKCGHELGRYS